MLTANPMRELPHKNKLEHQKDDGRGFEGQSPAVRRGINRDARNQRRQTENKRSVAKQKSAPRGSGNILASGDENRDANRGKRRKRDKSKQTELDSSVHRSFISLRHGDFDVVTPRKIDSFAIARVDVTR